MSPRTLGQRRSENAAAKPAATSRSLSPNLRHVLQRMWRMGYGTIRGLHVRDGDPLVDPPFAAVRSVRLSSSPAPQIDTASTEFSLKAEHLRFQQELASIGDGVIDVVKVHDGLPVGLEIHEPA